MFPVFRIIHTPACCHAHILPYKESLPRGGWWEMLKLFYGHTVVMKEHVAALCLACSHGEAAGVSSTL